MVSKESKYLSKINPKINISEKSEVLDDSSKEKINKSLPPPEPLPPPQVEGLPPPEPLPPPQIDGLPPPEPDAEQSNLAFYLQLGDIIQLDSPNNMDLHEKIFYIKFLNSTKIVLVSPEKTITLSISETGKITEESIENIIILSREESPSYIVQNNIELKKNISIYFGEPIPKVINGIITNIEEDMIEITLLSTNEVIYIDFAYSGIPEDLNIEKIVLKDSSDLLLKEEVTEEVEDSEISESYLNLDNKDDIDYELINNKTNIGEILLDTVVFEEEYEEMYHTVNVSDDQKRYTLDVQINNYLDVMLGKYKSSEINENITNMINLEILRYKELREIYSEFDVNNNPNLPEKRGEFHKPLKDLLFNLNKKIYWILPNVSVYKNLINEIDDSSDSESEIQKIKMGEFIEQLNQIINKWYKNSSKDAVYNYTNYINNLLNIYDNVINKYDSEIVPNSIELNNLNVNTQLDVINDLYGDFYSYAIKNDNVENSRFLMEVYNNGLKMIETQYINNKKIYKFKQLVPCDKITILSFLTLPLPIFKFSKINCDYTKLYQKSNLSLHFIDYQNLLNTNTILNKYILDEKSIPKFINTNNNISDDLLKKINHFSIDDSIDQTPEEKYNALLESFIPTTSILIKNLSETNKYLNFESLLQDIQSANIDMYNFHIVDMKMIKSIFDKDIYQYKQKYISDKDDLIAILSILNREIVKESGDYLMDFNILNKELKTDVIEFYKIDETIYNSNSELLNTFTKIDGGKFFMNALNKNIMDLLVGNLVENFIKQSKQLEKSEKSEELEKELERQKENCEKYYLSKKYSSLEALEEDNNRKIFFDAIYDNTVYSIINEYNNERETMDTDTFFKFLTDKLMEIMNITQDKALREAKAIIEEKREIIDGDYALLINKQDNKNYIYIRQNNTWILDDKFKSDFYVDSNRIFCDINQECISKDDKCNSVESMKKDSKKDNIDKILENFEAKYNLSIEELKGKINDSYENSKKYLERIININYHKSRNIHEMLQQYYMDLDQDIQLSPYEDLKDIILSINDFPKRQEYIKKFCLKFTRNSINDEDTHWLYCIKTGIKILPTFIFKLANAFINKLDYNLEVDKICADQGTISDDNNYWVDKYSGYIIKRIEFDTDEGYDEKGFKLNTKATMEDDIIINLNVLNKSINPDIKIITSIIKTMSQMIGINLEKHNDFIISNVVSIQKTNIPSEEDYKKLLLKIAKKEGKTKSQPSYENVYNSSLLLLTLIYIIVSIQISIPGIKTKKTFPGCIKSFSGYPLDGDQDKTSIVYIACVANKIKSSIKPWDTLLKMSESAIVKKLEALIDRYIISDKKIDELMNKKREFLLHNKNDVQEELLINNWHNFLPPLIDLHISKENTLPLSDTFQSELLESFTKGKKNNIKEVLISKIIFLSNSIIESIQTIVKKHSALLENNAGEPFLENACCNSGLNAINFFMNLDKSIIENNKLSNFYNNILESIKIINTPSILYDPANTKFIIPKIEKDFNEFIIYKAFIYYCNFNNDLPVDEKLKGICLDKPVDFTSTNIVDDINVLKSQGKIYNKNSLLDLLTIISREKLILIDIKVPELNNIEKMREIISTYTETHEEDQIDEKLFENLNELLDTFDITKPKNMKELNAVKNHILSVNTILKNNIMEFVKKQSSISKQFYANFEKLLDITVKIDINNTKFYMEYVNNLLNIFPNIILNKSINYNAIPKHWNVSDLHKKDIEGFIEKYYEKLMNFSALPEMELVFKLVKNKCSILMDVLRVTFYNEPITASNSGNKLQIGSIFDEELVTFFYNYVYLNIVNEYINITDNTLFNLEIGSYDSYNKEELNIKILTFINDFYTIMSDHNNLINNGYKKVKEKISYAKEKEKDLITDYLKHLTDEEREIENLFKINKLEKWSKGLQKGLTQYVAENYDEERMEMEKQIIKEKKLNMNNNVSDMNRELYKMDLEEEEQLAQEIEDEEYSMGNIPDDDDFNSDDEY